MQQAQGDVRGTKRLDHPRGHGLLRRDAVEGQDDPILKDSIRE
jgi:hypothetical protein